MPPAKIATQPRSLRVSVSASDHVTALLYRAAPARRLGVPVILAHGAGADQHSGFMVQLASGLAARGLDTVTFNFLYTEQGRRLPDRNDKLEACWRAVIAAVRAGDLPSGDDSGRLVIGGKSMGARIATQVASQPPPDREGGIAGLVCLGYPLHPPGRPDKLRSEHLGRIRAPMVFIQGARDTFGTPAELRTALADVKAERDLYVVEGGDHSFKVPKRVGVPQDQVYAAVYDEIVRWITTRVTKRPP